MRALGTDRPTSTFGRSILDLPRVVEDVPRGTADEVADRHHLAAPRPSLRNAVADAPFDCLDDRGAEVVRRGPRIFLVDARRLPGDPTEVRRVGGEHVRDD